MSSAATSGDSRRVEQLSHNPRRLHLRSSSLRALRSILRKPTSEEPTPVLQSYEVAPGILNTDATAIVFGYLDREAEEKKEQQRAAKAWKKSKISSPKIHTGSGRSISPAKIKRPIGCERSKSPVKKLVDRYKEVHADDGSDDFTTRAHRMRREARDQERQARRDAAKREILDTARRERRGRMRTVSRDDEIVERGANPRTGVISPWVTSEQSASDSGYSSDYIQARPQPVPSKLQGSWKQDSDGWNMVEPSAKELRKVAENTLLVNMPGVDDPQPPSMTLEQIQKYQKGIMKVLKHAEGQGFADPFQATTPREGTPDVASSPPNKFQKIARKAVGTGTTQRNDSPETVVLNDKARSFSMPTPRKAHQPRGFHVMTPIEGSRNPSVHQTEQPAAKGVPFLGPGPSPSQLQSLCSRINMPRGSPQNQQKMVPPVRGNSEYHEYCEAYSEPRRLHPRLNSYSNSPMIQNALPRLRPRLPQPPPFQSNPLFYRRSPPLQPPPPQQRRLRPAQNRQEAVMGVHTSTTTTTTTANPHQASGSSVSPRPGPQQLRNPSPATIQPHHRRQQSQYHVQETEAKAQTENSEPTIKVQPILQKPQDSNPALKLATTAVVAALGEYQSATPKHMFTVSEHGSPNPRQRPRPRQENRQSEIREGEVTEKIMGQYAGDTHSDSQLGGFRYMEASEKLTKLDQFLTNGTHISGDQGCEKGCGKGKRHVTVKDLPPNPPITEDSFGVGATHSSSLDGRKASKATGLRKRSGIQGKSPEELGREWFAMHLCTEGRTKAKDAADMRSKTHARKISRTIKVDEYNLETDSDDPFTDSGSVKSNKNRSVGTNSSELRRKDSLLRRALQASTNWTHTADKPGNTYLLTFLHSERAAAFLSVLAGMVWHIFTTLSPTSAAIVTLRQKEVVDRDKYFAAFKDVCKAGGYICVLLSTALLLGRVIRSIVAVALMLWGPFRVVGVVVKWFLVG